MKLLDRFEKPFSPHLIVPRAQHCRAYQFADGFDNYNSVTEMYPTTAGSGFFTFGSIYARFAPPAGCPGQGLKVVNSSVRQNLKSNQATLIIKLAFNVPTLSGGGTSLIMVLDNNTVQCSLWFLGSGVLEIRNGGGGTVLAATSGPVFTGNNYYGIEWQVTVNSSTGSSQVWVNGVEVLNATGLNTQSSSNAYANQVQIGDCFPAGYTIYLDDFRVWDNTGGIENAALGTDSRIITKLPSGAGATTQWTPNGASANWQCVDDNPPDGDTSYVSCSTVNDTDEYTAPVAGFTQPPKMVLARIYARKDDAGARSVEFGVTSGSASLSGSNASMASGYAFYDGDCTAEDPNTLGPWSAAAADAAGFWKMETA